MGPPLTLSEARFVHGALSSQGRKGAKKASAAAATTTKAKVAKAAKAKVAAKKKTKKAEAAAPLSVLSKLRLQSALHTSNMHLVDPSGAVKRYESAEEIAGDWFGVRHQQYAQRRSLQLDGLRRRAAEQQQRCRFVELVCDGTLQLTQRPVRVQVIYIIVCYIMVCLKCIVQLSRGLHMNRRRRRSPSDFDLPKRVSKMSCFKT